MLSKKEKERIKRFVENFVRHNKDDLLKFFDDAKKISCILPKDIVQIRHGEIRDTRKRHTIEAHILVCDRCAKMYFALDGMEEFEKELESMIPDFDLPLPELIKQEIERQGKKERS